MRVADLIVEYPIEGGAMSSFDVLFPEAHRLETQAFEDEVLEYGFVESSCWFL